MSEYRNLYEKYYNNLKRNNGSYNMKSKNKKSTVMDKCSNRKVEKLVNKFIIQLAISVILIVIFMGCRVVNNNYTKEIFSLAKTQMTKTYDYKKALNYIKNLSLDDMENISVNFIDKVKSKIIGGKTILEELRTEYSIPVMANKSNNLDEFEKDKNKILKVKVNDVQEIKNCNDGKVKKIDVDEKLGKYIVIDHGKGIESKYYNMTDIFVKQGEKIKKGDVIGEVNGKDKESNFYFEILYMGKAQDVYEYMAI